MASGIACAEDVTVTEDASGHYTSKQARASISITGKVLRNQAGQTLGNELGVSNQSFGAGNPRASRPAYPGFAKQLRQQRLIIA